MELNIHKSHLLEVSRKDLVTKSRTQDKGRYKRRLNYQVSNFRGVDLKEMFENDYFVFKTPIKDYVCVVAFPGVFSQLRKVVKETHGDATKINLQMVIKALRRAFDATDDVKVDCTCADWRYRYAYWATQNGYKYGAPESRPSDITNPDDAIGATCKHLNLLLSNKRWLTKAASVVNSFIKAYPDKAALYLYDEDEIVKNLDKDEIQDKEVNKEEVPEESPDIEKDEEVPSEEVDETPSVEDTNDERNDSITDSLKLTEADRVYDDDIFSDPSGAGREWIPEQRKRLSEFRQRIEKYAEKYGLSDLVKFRGHEKYDRRDNISHYTIFCNDKKYRDFIVRYRDGKYILYNLNAASKVEKYNQDPQKIVKYLFDVYVF